MSATVRSACASKRPLLEKGDRGKAGKRLLGSMSGPGRGALPGPLAKVKSHYNQVIKKGGLENGF
jgi:hypothetical protein